MKINATHALESLEPSEAQIQHQAYLLWLAGGCQTGRELDDWLYAREMLRRKHGRSTDKTRRHLPKKPVIERT
ncbi:MAG: DUF2934 domain-containing protein [Opitutaceae bacterium]|jgi:Protein of unknown function (DUF2934)